MEANRIMKFIIPVSLIVDMLTTGSTSAIECIEGIPIGSKFVSLYHDFNTRLVHVVVSHPSFDEVEYGNVITTINITLTHLKAYPQVTVEIPINLIAN